MLPKYILKLISNQRIKAASFEEQEKNLDAYGYTFRLYRLNNNQWSNTLEAEAKQLCQWASREGAESRVVGRKYFTDKEHRKPYYKRDYIIVVITDPVANWLEKAMKEG